MFPDIFDYHSRFESRYSIACGTCPQCPLLGHVPPVPEVSPSLAEVVFATILIHVINGTFVYFLRGQVGAFGVIQRDGGMLMKVNPKFFNNNPAVLDWEEIWSIALFERGGAGQTGIHTSPALRIKTGGRHVLILLPMSWLTLF